MQPLFYSDQNLIKTICDQHYHKALPPDAINSKRILCEMIDEYEKLQQKRKGSFQINCKHLMQLLNNASPIEIESVIEMCSDLETFLDYNPKTEKIILGDMTLEASLEMFDKIIGDNVRTTFKMMQEEFLSDAERQNVEFLIKYGIAKGNIQ